MQYYKRLLIFSIIALFVVAPTNLSTNLPSLIKIRVGIFLTPYSATISEFSSTSHLNTATLPLNSSDSSSTIGEIALHGPHHGAQKSTKTGLLFPLTRSLKLLSVITSAILIVF